MEIDFLKKISNVVRSADELVNILNSENNIKKIDKTPDMAKTIKNLEYDYSPNKKKTGITTLLNEIKKTGIELIDVQTKQSNLEQIFVEILKND